MPRQWAGLLQQVQGADHVGSGHRRNLRAVDGAVDVGLGGKVTMASGGARHSRRARPARSAISPCTKACAGCASSDASVRWLPAPGELVQIDHAHAAPGQRVEHEIAADSRHHQSRAGSSCDAVAPGQAARRARGHHKPARVADAPRAAAAHAGKGPRRQPAPLRPLAWRRQPILHARAQDQRDRDQHHSRAKAVRVPAARTSTSAPARSAHPCRGQPPRHERGPQSAGRGLRDRAEQPGPPGRGPVYRRGRHDGRVVGGLE